MKGQCPRSRLFPLFYILSRMHWRLFCLLCFTCERPVLTVSGLIWYYFDSTSSLYKAVESIDIFLKDEKVQSGCKTSTHKKSSKTIKRMPSPDKGLEPLTLRLKVWCSTDWANRAITNGAGEQYVYIADRSFIYHRGAWLYYGGQFCRLMSTVALVPLVKQDQTHTPKF